MPSIRPSSAALAAAIATATADEDTAPAGAAVSSAEEAATTNDPAPNFDYIDSSHPC
jgi:hypothetical protein